MTDRKKSRARSCGISISHEDTFTWTTDDETYSLKQSSDLFQFLGYRCYFLYAPYIPELTYDLSLHGYPVKCKKSTFCHYSLIVKNADGRVYHSAIGKIEISGKCMDIVLCRHLRLPVKTKFVFFFSWSENENCEENSQDVKTKPVLCTNATQTEVVQFLPSRNISSGAENESYNFLKILSKDLCRLYESKKDTDCVLKVGETNFHVHRSVLAARCAVFEAMFRHDTSESRSGKVVIRDVDANVFGDILYYIYAGDVRGLSPDTAVVMYVVADKYSLIDFRDKCLDFLMCNLTVENVYEAAVLAHTHAEIKLEEKVTEFFAERLNDLKGNERWKIFSETHPKLANNLLFSALVCIKERASK